MSLDCWRWVLWHLSLLYDTDTCHSHCRVMSLTCHSHCRVLSLTCHSHCRVLGVQSHSRHDTAPPDLVLLLPHRVVCGGHDGWRCEEGLSSQVDVLTSGRGGCWHDKCTLVLDLDETLIHSVLDPLTNVTTTYERPGSSVLSVVCCPPLAHTQFTLCL